MKKKTIIRKDLKKHGHKAVHDSTIMNEVGYITWTLRKDGIHKTKHAKYKAEKLTVVDEKKAMLISNLHRINYHTKQKAEAKYSPINFNVDDYYLSDPNIHTYNVYAKRHNKPAFVKMYKNRFASIEWFIKQCISEENISN